MCDCEIDQLGTKRWYKDGILHREDGPAIEYVDGSKRWFNDGKLHREDGPAIEYCYGSKYWYKQGKVHREDGPAIELANGKVEYWLNDCLMSEMEYFVKNGSIN